MRFVMMALGLLAVSACQPPRPEAPAQTGPVTPDPTIPDSAAAPGCSWEKVESRSFVLWAQGCITDNGRATHFEAGMENGVEVLKELTGADRPRAVVKVFTKPDAAPITAILPALGLQAQACGFEPAAAGPTGERFVLSPTGAAKTRYEKAVAAGDEPGPVCGLHGIGPVGERLFELRAERPDLVLWFDYGSDPPGYEPNSLALKQRAEPAPAEAEEPKRAGPVKPQ